MCGFGDSLNVKKLSSEVVDTAQQHEGHTVAFLVDPVDYVLSSEVVFSLQSHSLVTARWTLTAANSGVNLPRVVS